MQVAAYLALLLATAPAWSQQPAARERVAVRLLDEDGGAWRNAQVVFVSSSARYGGSPEDDDRVTVRGDAQGRARAELLAGRRYEAYAFSDAGDGRYRVSELAAPVVAGRAVRLSCSGQRPRTRVAVITAPGVSGQGPFRVVFDALGEQSLTVPASGSAELPPLPVLPPSVVCVVGPSGRVLRERRVPLTGEVVSLVVPPPLPIRVRVVDSKARPVAGAELIQQAGSRFVSLGTTDKSGMFRGVIPHQRFALRRVRLQGQCLVRAEGHELSLLPIRFDLPGSGMVDPARPDLVVGVGRGIRIRGRVWMSKGRPARGMLLALAGAGTFSGPRGSRVDRSFVVPYRWRCADDGSFDVRVSRRFAWRLTALPTRAQLAELARGGRVIAPFVWLAGNVAGDHDVDLGDLFLDRVPRVSLRIRSQSGEPAAGCEVLIGEAGSANHLAEVVEHPLRACADGTGRLELLVRSDSKPAVAASWNGGLGYSELPERGAHEVTLQPTVLVTGAIEAPSRAPLPGIRVQATMTDFIVNGKRHLFAKLARTWSAVTDEDGRYRMRLPAASEYRLTGRGESRALLRGERVLWVETEDRTGIDIPVLEAAGKKQGGFQAMIRLFDASVEKIALPLR